MLFSKSLRFRHSTVSRAPWKAGLAADATAAIIASRARAKEEPKVAIQPRAAATRAVARVTARGLTARARVEGEAHDQITRKRVQTSRL